jgi:hypothetical protein
VCFGQTIDNKLRGVAFDKDKVAEWTAKISEECLQGCRAIEKPFKFVGAYAHLCVRGPVFLPQCCPKCYDLGVFMNYCLTCAVTVPLLCCLIVRASVPLPALDTCALRKEFLKKYDYVILLWLSRSELHDLATNRRWPAHVQLLLVELQN